jgi:hypothetical protein
MILFEKSADFLFHEFSNITVDIKITDSYVDGYVNGIDISTYNEFGIVHCPKVYHFELTFNSDFHADGALSKGINYEYFNYITKKKLEFYQELDDTINSENSLLKINNLLRSYKIRFKELLSNYYLQKWNYLNISHDWVNCKVLKETFSDSRLIDYVVKERLLHSFLIVQKETIENILRYIDDKIALLESFESVNENKSDNQKSRDNSPVTKIDQYQVTLLFEYLKEVGVIKQFDSNISISEAVSKLTGFSKHHLRTRCFPYIWQIKSGKVGNINSIKKDSDFNLKIVKNLIMEVNNKIIEDLDKNTKSKEDHNIL